VRIETRARSRARRITVAGLVALAGTSGPGCRAPQPQLPDTPAAHQFAAWLAAFDSADSAAFGAFVRQSYPSDSDRLAQNLSFRDRTGGFDLKKLDESTATHCSVLVQERESDQFARIDIDVDSVAPYHIQRIGFRPVSRPAEFAIPRLSEHDLVAALRDKLVRDAAADRFSGTVLLAKNGATVFSGAYGMADRDKRIPNTLTTRFRIGSMNKMFTAVSVLQLVQAGKIGLQDPLGKYLTDYPNRDVASKVTIHHLLTHTGGTGDFFGPEFDAHRLELRTLQDYLGLFGKRGLVATPSGEKYAYGFGDNVANGVRSFGHSGGAPGMNGDLEIFPQSGYVVAVLSNLDPPAAQRISAFIAARVPAD
jgi:CubicO group peptidase (beta-lactamase class C family)